MGSIISMTNAKARSDGSEFNEVSPNETYKRPRMTSIFDEECSRLIPNFPDELSLQIIARIPRICHFNMRLVSRKWNETLMSSELYKVRKELGTTEEWLYLLTKAADNKLSWHALDPRSQVWQRLPAMPNVADEEESRMGSSRLWMWNVVGGIKIADVIRGMLGRKGAFDEMLFCGCAIGAVDGCLYVLGGFSNTSTMRCVWRFDPIRNRWNKVTSMSTGRAYCKTGILNNKLYVVGGVSQGKAGLIPLESVEVFDPCTDTWSHLPSMPFSGARGLPAAFMSDMLKPIATGLTSYMGRLFVPQSLYSWPFFVDAGGEIYDPETNSWMEMPAGMGKGWPARQAGTKLSVVVDGTLYASDPSNSTDSGRIMVYDRTEDAWKVVNGKVPIYDSADSDYPLLLAGLHGRLHVITKDANHDIAVLQAELHNNLDSSPSTKTPLSPKSFHEFPESAGGSDADGWKVVVRRGFGNAELVSCQVINI